MLDRVRFVDALPGKIWDVLIIGGGATGLAAALDAASRGYETLLVEAGDFANATSSRSTKLIHGGVRYLRQGNISLVRESLHERGLLLQNARGLVRPLEFIIPTRSFLESAFYATGLKMYDLLAGSLGIEASKRLSKDQVLQRTPTLSPHSLSGGVSYFDAQFDDARLALAMARTAAAQNGKLLNRFRVTGFLKVGGKISGVAVRDGESGRDYELSSRVVINATGIFSDEMQSLDEPEHSRSLAPSQGVHLVLDRQFLPGETAIIVPKTDDGRVLFLIPWHGAVLVGTTDTPVNGSLADPRPRSEEIDYLLDYGRKYLIRSPERRDVRSVFVGVRPLVKAGTGRKSSQLSRDHVISVSTSGLVSIAGGKWTTCRRMGEDAVETAIRVGGLEHRPCVTKSLLLTEGESATPPGEGVSIHDDQIVRGVREEMALTVEDVLARRTRLLFVNAQAAIDAAPHVAAVMARELGRDSRWADGQVREFERIARGYLVE